MAVNWLDIKAEYIKNEGMSLDAVATKHGINASYLRFKASQEKWKEEKDKAQQKANEIVTERLPENIADTKLRHARIGRNLQNTALRGLLGDAQQGIKPLQPSGYGEAVNAIVKGVNIERQALGMNDKEVQDEVFTKFQQFTFIFNLGDDELQRFIKSIESTGPIEAQGPGNSIPEVTGQTTANG